MPEFSLLDSFWSRIDRSYSARAFEWLFHHLLSVRYEFPDGTITDQSALITLITESYKSDCLDSIAYIADTNAYALIVFDMAQRTSWRVNSPYFHPFPHKATMYSNGVVFELMDGIFGITLSEYSNARKSNTSSLNCAWYLIVDNSYYPVYKLRLNVTRGCYSVVTRWGIPMGPSPGDNWVIVTFKMVGKSHE